MRKLILSFFCVFPLALPWVAYPQSKKATNTGKDQTAARLTARQIADRALRSVVLIVTTDEEGQPVSQGSGFVFRPGLVVTNLHIFARATNAIVKTLESGKRHNAVEVVAMNAKYDLCVIRLDDRSIPSLPLAATGGTRIGDEVYVASNPEGLEGSVSKGIVSGLRIEAGLLQVDAAISPGSSGGAVINQQGEVVGIVKSSLVAGQNLNFAIPVEYLKSLPLDFTLPVIVAGACANRDRDKDKLKGLVKSVVEKETMTFNTNTGKQEEVVVPSIRVYDIDGNMVEFYGYAVKPDTLEVVLWVKQVMTYDENRLLTQVIDARKGKTGTIGFAFDERVRKKLANRQFSGTFDTEYGIKTYDSDGNMTKWMIKIPSSATLKESWQRNVYTYERDGQMKERSAYVGNTLSFKERYSYDNDDRGNWIAKQEEMFSPEKGWGSMSKVTYREITYFK